MTSLFLRFNSRFPCVGRSSSLSCLRVWAHEGRFGTTQYIRSTLLFICTYTLLLFTVFYVVWIFDPVYRTWGIQSLQTSSTSVLASPWRIFTLVLYSELTTFLVSRSSGFVDTPIDHLFPLPRVWTDPFKPNPNFSCWS